jgi:hypothetical protein
MHNHLTSQLHKEKYGFWSHFDGEIGQNNVAIRVKQPIMDTPFSSKLPATLLYNR